MKQRFRRIKRPFLVSGLLLVAGALSACTPSGQVTPTSEGGIESRSVEKPQRPMNQAASPSTVTLDEPLHFTAPDGSDVEVPTGTYQVEPTGELRLRLSPASGGAPLLIQAQSTTHSETVESPVALTVVTDENRRDLVLFMPNGTTLDAIGTLSGVRTRGGMMVPLAPQQLAGAMTMQPRFGRKFTPVPRREGLPGGPHIGTQIPQQLQTQPGSELQKALIGKAEQQKLLANPQLGSACHRGPDGKLLPADRFFNVNFLAKATGPFSVELSWTGPPVLYEITGTMGGGGPIYINDPDRQTNLAIKGSQSQPQMAPQSRQQTPLGGQAFMSPDQPQTRTYTFRHERPGYPVQPDFQYHYLIKATSPDGKIICQGAIAKTLPAPPAPETPARTQPLGAPPVQIARTLTVVTVNTGNSFVLGRDITWDIKMDRLAGHLVASGQVPDIISMTESAGWVNCSSPAHDNTGHYDMVDRLIWRLRNGVGVTYRVAYLVGSEGSFGGLGSFAPRCRFYSGDTVLYNPNRITNLTPSDVAGRPQVLHDSTHLGLLIRRSLPICSRGANTNIPNLEQLIDGPLHIDRCNVGTPSAPAWAWQVDYPGGGYSVVATLARFGLVGVPNSSFDVVTTHPTHRYERFHHAPISNFIAALTAPPYRTTQPYYPTIILGDFNCLTGQPPYNCEDDGPPTPTTSWPTGTTQVFRSPDDVMVVGLGNGGSALPSLRTLSMVLGATLPGPQPCRPLEEERIRTGIEYFADRSFSDHCGLIVRFSE